MAALAGAGGARPAAAVGDDDLIAAVMRKVMTDNGSSHSLQLRAASALSRHAKSLRQATKRARVAPGATTDPGYTPGPLGWLHTAGRSQADGMEALARHMRGEDAPFDEIEEYHPPEWIAMLEFLLRRRLTLSPADQTFIDGLQRRLESGPEPSTTESERLGSVFWAAGGTAEYLAAPGEA